MDLGLRGRVAVVAAGSKGLGRAVALELAAEGADVAICARGMAALEDAASAIRALGVRAHVIAADVSVAVSTNSTGLPRKASISGNTGRLGIPNTQRTPACSRVLTMRSLLFIRNASRE